MHGAEQCAAHWRKAGFAVKPEKKPFKALYSLAALAPVAPRAWRPTNDEGQALLAGLGLDPLPAREMAATALRQPWPAIAPIRQRRIMG